MGMGHVYLFVYSTLYLAIQRYVELMFKKWLLASRMTSPRYGTRFTLPPHGVGVTELIYFPEAHIVSYWQSCHFYMSVAERLV